VINKIKRPLKGKRFSTPEELKNAVQDIIDKLNAEKSLIGTSKLPNVWEEVMENDGNYLF